MKQTNQKYMPFPRRLRVGKRWYSIDVVETMVNKSEMGRVHYANKRIELARRSHHGAKITEGDMQETFWHELTHAILHDMGETSLNNDERFVEEFSARLYKAVQTARF